MFSPVFYSLPWARANSLNIAFSAKNGVTPLKWLCPLWRASSMKDDFPAPVQEVKNSEASKASEAKGKAKAIATGLGLSH